jgi:hypothetical protein
LLNVTLSPGEDLKVQAPEASNITLISVVGGQYDIGLSVSGGKNQLAFSPVEEQNLSSYYSMMVNVSLPSASGENFAYISTAQPGALNFSKNITGVGNIVLDINLNVQSGQLSSDSSSWNPLFGFTGFNLGGVSLSAADILAILALISIGLIISGTKFSMKLLYCGLFFLGLVAVVAVGIFLVGAVVGVYLLGFVITKSYFRLRSHRKGEGGTASSGSAPKGL